jgi:small subunit ribosomal protein S21
MKVEIRNGNVDRGIRLLKKKLSEDGIFRLLQERRVYEKPSEIRNRKHRAAIVRQKRSDREQSE